MRCLSLWCWNTRELFWFINLFSMWELYRFCTKTRICCCRRRRSADKRHAGAGHCAERYRHARRPGLWLHPGTARQQVRTRSEVVLQQPPGTRVSVDIQQATSVPRSTEGTSEPYLPCDTGRVDHVPRLPDHHAHRGAQWRVQVPRVHLRQGGLPLKKDGHLWWVSRIFIHKLVILCM